MVQSYIFLQEKRFGDRISFDLAVPETIPTVSIPGMSMQPLVENAINHGVQNTLEGGLVRVIIQVRSDYIEATIEDNGMGIDPEILVAIQCGELPPTAKGGHGIGLLNVIQRMDRFYHRSGLIQLDSSPGHGTRITLQYPLSE
jgi:sensor histidine kinase YesM